MSQSLLLLVGSSRPGVYINTMSYAVDNIEHIDRFVVVNIVGASIGDNNDFEEMINKSLWDLLSQLAQGTYGSKSISAKYSQLYAKVKDLYAYRSTERLNYIFLRSEVRRLRERYGSGAIVDITSVPKRVAIDVLAACLAEGMTQVTLFELKRQGERLYHELSQSEYEYLVIPDRTPLMTNIEVFMAKRNFQKFMSVIITICISILIMVFAQLGLGGLGGWLMTVLMAAFSIIGGISPIIDALGGINSLLTSWRRS